ncbi:MAG: hypothetical protein LBH76_05050, partial [Propionibacteriaceae bacterium]|nr:hypothetical protein [Propionibacteriaceae bacterium]
PGQQSGFPPGPPPGFPPGPPPEYPPGPPPEFSPGPPPQFAAATPPDAYPDPAAPDFAPTAGPPGAYPPFQPADSPAPPARPRSRRPPVVVAIVLGAVVLIAAAVFGVNSYLASVRADRYETAVAAMDQADYQTAYDLFADLGEYEDAASLAALCRQHLDYEAADELFEAEAFKEAKAIFDELGDFLDAPERSRECARHLDFIAGQEAYDKGEFDKAIGIFERLDDAGFPGADLWYNKSYYAKADQLLRDGDHYGAYRAFRELGGYEDAAERAEACALPFPATGELYHHEGYVSSAVTLVIDGSDMTTPALVKVYDGSTLVLTLAVNAGTTISADLPSATYLFTEAYGQRWFGDTDLFGADAKYFTMNWSDGPTEVLIESGHRFTITLNPRANGPSIEREEF